MINSEQGISIFKFKTEVEKLLGPFLQCLVKTCWNAVFILCYRLNSAG